MLDFASNVFDVAWACISYDIPITSGVTITVWQIMMFGAAVGILLKYLFNRGVSN